MTHPPDRMTRVTADLMDSAAVEGARHGRSATQQLDHWARVGRAVSSQQATVRRRVDAALAGDLELRELGAGESAVLNAELDAAIQENLAASHYGTLLAERGITTVALDENGDLVEHRPDGSSVVLDGAEKSSGKLRPATATGPAPRPSGPVKTGELMRELRDAERS